MECEPLRAATKKVLFRNGLVSVIDKSQRPKCQKYSNIATEKALIKDGSAMGETYEKKKKIFFLNSLLVKLNVLNWMF